MGNIITMFKQMFCKHEWKEITSGILGTDFGCDKCGETYRVSNSDVKRWKFVRKYKGERFK